MTTQDKLKAIAENEQRVYEAGKTAEWNAFWDAFQQNGERTVYANTFWQGGWSDSNFKPKYDIRPTSLNYAFQNSLIKNVKSILEQQGVTLDTVNTTNMSYMFNAAKVTRLPTLDCRTVGTNNLQYAFYQAADLISIDEIILKEDGTQAFSYTFMSCTDLREIRFSGCIGQNISFSGDNKLSHDSLMSIINALADGVSKTLTIGSTNMAKLTEDELKIASDKGWMVK